MLQDVVSTTMCEEGHSSTRGRQFTWWSVTVTTLYLKCGHTKVYRGSYVPKKRVRCKQCAPC